MKLSRDGISIRPCYVQWGKIMWADSLGLCVFGWLVRDFK